MTDHSNFIPDPLHKPDRTPHSFYGAHYPTGHGPTPQSGEIELTPEERAIVARSREKRAFLQEQQDRIAQERSEAAEAAKIERLNSNELIIHQYLLTRFPGSRENFNLDFQALRDSLLSRIVAGEITMSDIRREVLDRPNYHGEF